MDGAVPLGVSFEGMHGQAVYVSPVIEPGVTVAFHTLDGGTPAHLVEYGRTGAVPVWFVNGPPVGSIEWALEESRRQQDQYAAQAAAWSATSAHEARVAAGVIAEHHLLQL